MGKTNHICRHCRKNGDLKKYESVVKSLKKLDCIVTSVYLTSTIYLQAML